MASDEERRPASGPAFPERVGRYELLLPIASGGMATVYLANARGPAGFETEVALKLTHGHLRESSEFVVDLLEEAKLAARIRHRNVVPVFDAGDDPAGVFLVMEYVEGDTLAGLRKRAGAGSGDAVPVAVGMRILLDAMAGLHAAHELRGENGAPLGLVHRDFTPQNILVGLDGVARLTDFGIAKAATRLGHTRTGFVKGKIAYMSPEQARGRTLDRRCDVWAAGVIAWELLAGKRLYPGEDEVAVLLKVVTSPPPPLRRVSSGVPQDVDAAVMAALRVDPSARTPTAAAFARDLATACRAHGWLAEQEEVAECVSRLVTAKLAARRASVLEVRALRAKVNVIASASVDRAGATPSGSSEAAAPVAVGETDGRGLAVTAREVPTASPSEATLADAGELAGTGTPSVVESLPGLPRSTAGRRRLFAVGVLASAAIATVFVIAPRSPSPTAIAPQAASAATAAPIDQAPAFAAVSVKAPASPATLLVLHLTANAKVVSVRIGERSILLVKPASEVDVDLSGVDRHGDVRVEAVSTDGRRASVSLGADAVEAVLHFPSGRVPQGSPRPSPAQPGRIPPSPY